MSVTTTGGADLHPYVETAGLAAAADHIVFHFDGNNNDPDDIAAMPIAGLLTVAAGMEDKTTFLYGNNLSEKNSPKLLNKLIDSGEFCDDLGIECMNYQADTAATTARLVEILESGQSVLLIDGGPMEATYRALELVDERFHSNVTQLSHSVWNEKRTVINRPDVTEARDFEDIAEDFPDVKQVEIRDQNGAGKLGFYSSLWSWMDESDDPVIQEARALMRQAPNEYGKVKINDASDAGMLFYALTGKSRGSPTDAKDFIDAATAFSDDTDHGFTVHLIDPATDRRVATIDDGDTILTSVLSSNQFAIEVEVEDGAKVESVGFEFDGHRQVENVEPYALFGDRSSDFNGRALTHGEQAMSLTFYSRDNAKGSALEFDVNFAFKADAPPVNHKPIARNDSISLREDGSATIAVLENDEDEDGDRLSPSIIDGPSEGSAWFNDDGSLTYTPDADFSGDDSLRYKVSDGRGGSDTAYVSFDVMEKADAATVKDVHVAVMQDAPAYALTLFANDFRDGGSDQLYFRTLADADGNENGDATLAGEASVLFYTPDEGFSGREVLDVALWDQYEAASTATAKLFVDVVAEPALVAAYNIGGKEYVSAESGITYEADTLRTGKKFRIDKGSAIDGTTDDRIYTNESWSPKGLSYDFDVADGTYLVKLHFAEIFPPLFADDRTIFDIVLESEVAAENVDVYDQVGARRALELDFLVEVTDGELDLALERGPDGKGDPRLSALEIWQVDDAAAANVSHDTLLDLFN